MGGRCTHLFDHPSVLLQLHGQEFHELQPRKKVAEGHSATMPQRLSAINSQGSEVRKPLSFFKSRCRRSMNRKQVVWSSWEKRLSAKATLVGCHQLLEVSYCHLSRFVTSYERSAIATFVGMSPATRGQLQPPE